MIGKRLFKVMRSYVFDFVEKKEQQFSLDEDEEKEFREWQRQQRSKNNEDDYEQRSRSSSYESEYKKSTVDKDEKYFKDLEMEPTNDFDKIKKQYRKLMKMYHPDRYNNDDSKRKTAEKITSKLNEAYEHFQDKHGVK